MLLPVRSNPIYVKKTVVDALARLKLSVNICKKTAICNDVAENLILPDIIEEEIHWRCVK
jgi:hypothetical protein